jgi:hypothetical protein
MYHVPPKRLYPHTRLHHLTNQKNTIRLIPEDGETMAVLVSKYQATQCHSQADHWTFFYPWRWRQYISRNLDTNHPDYTVTQPSITRRMLDPHQSHITAVTAHYTVKQNSHTTQCRVSHPHNTANNIPLNSETICCWRNITHGVDNLTPSGEQVETFT